MKGDYNIQDKALFDTLTALVEEFDRVNVTYAVIGGVAVQLYIAALRSNNGEYPVNKCPGLDTLLRRTGDVDIIVKSEEFPMVYFFNNFANYHNQFRVVNAKNYALIDKITINYMDSADKLKWFGHLYLRTLDTANKLRLSYGKQALSIKTQMIEFLIAAKLTGNRIQEKDFWDLATLLRESKRKGRSINYDTIKGILEDVHRLEQYAIIEQLRSEIA
ncbi:MAG: hypothetical protein AABX52_03475 [Nanoarchaeota archaeon]